MFAWGVWLRVRRWRAGGPDPRWGELHVRMRRLLVEGLFQSRILSQRYPGLMHAAIFWGFLALFIGTILATIDWEITRLLFDWRLLKGPFYLAFELVLDLFGVVLLVGVAMAAWRRFVMRPPRVTPDAKFAYALAVLAVLAVTGYLIEGARLAVTRPAWSAWSPVGHGGGERSPRVGAAGSRNCARCISACGSSTPWWCSGSSRRSRGRTSRT